MHKIPSHLPSLQEIQSKLQFLTLPEQALIRAYTVPEPDKYLLDFTLATYPQYKPDAFHALLADALDEISNGQNDRLIVTAPPQHGKSELTSVRFPAHYLGKNPDNPIIVASYAASLAEDKSRQIREIVESAEYSKIFPAVKTKQDTRSVELWRLEGHRGQVRAAGVGGGLTGFPGMLGLIDDPVSGYEEVMSANQRDKVWNWYRGVFRNRIWEGGAIVLIMCMTGDTPVLMADGTERPLRDVKVGDKVATYDNGKLNISTVLNHRSNGLDTVYRLRTTCGKTVYANERHPFLVSENGQLKWTRLKNLTTGQKIVTLKGNGESGKARLAQLKGATSLSVQEGIVPHITTRKNGPTEAAHHLLILNRAGIFVSNTAMELPLLNMTPCSKLRAESAPSANSRLEIMYGLIGAVNYASNIATKPEKLEDFCATTAIWPSGTLKPKQTPALLPSTSDFTITEIESITPAGVEEVFDVQIEGTENFIANGLVSHNTRWHEDDLVGRILNSAGGGRWKIIRCPAISENQEERDINNATYNLAPGLPDLLGREEGEALAPSRFSIDSLLEFKQDMGSMAFSALYQGAPRAAEGNLFKINNFRLIDRLGPVIEEMQPEPEPLPVPVNRPLFYGELTPKKEPNYDLIRLKKSNKSPKKVRCWDLAASTDKNADYTVGVLMSRDDSGQFFIEDIVRGQWAPKDRNDIILATAQKDGLDTHIWLEEEPGSAGKSVSDMFITLLAAFPVHVERSTGSKELRALPFAAQVEAGRVTLVGKPVTSSWVQPFLDEAASFPNGRHDDMVDAASRCVIKLSEEGAKKKKILRAF